MGSGGLPGLQNQRGGASAFLGGFDSHALPSVSRSATDLPPKLLIFVREVRSRP
jgi:hypothetical protein